MPHFSVAGWLAVLFIGVSSGIGYFLWLWALNHTTPTKVTIFLALSPLAGACLGAAMLTEDISSTFMAGLGCVGIGLWLGTQEIELPRSVHASNAPRGTRTS